MLPKEWKYPSVLGELEPVGLVAEESGRPGWVKPVQMVVMLYYLKELMRIS